MNRLKGNLVGQCQNYLPSFLSPHTLAAVKSAVLKASGTQHLIFSSPVLTHHAAAATSVLPFPWQRDVLAQAGPGFVVAMAFGSLTQSHLCKLLEP